MVIGMTGLLLSKRGPSVLRIPCAGTALLARNVDLRMRSAPATEGDGSYYSVGITRPRPDGPHPLAWLRAASRESTRKGQLEGGPSPSAGRLVVMDRQADAVILTR